MASFDEKDASSCRDPLRSRAMLPQQSLHRRTLRPPALASCRFLVEGVSVDGLFDSAWLKWGWSGRQGGSAQDGDPSCPCSEGETAGRRLQTRTEYDAKRHCLKAIITEIDPLPVTWGSEAQSHCPVDAETAWITLRGLSWDAAVVLLLMLTEGQRRGVYFPICALRADFNDAIDSAAHPKKRCKLPGVHVEQTSQSSAATNRTSAGRRREGPLPCHRGR